MSTLYRRHPKKVYCILCIPVFNVFIIYNVHRITHKFARRSVVSAPYQSRSTIPCITLKVVYVVPAPSYERHSSSSGSASGSALGSADSASLINFVREKSLSLILPFFPGNSWASSSLNSPCASFTISSGPMTLSYVCGFACPSVS